MKQYILNKTQFYITSKGPEIMVPTILIILNFQYYIYCD